MRNFLLPLWQLGDLENIVSIENGGNLVWSKYFDKASDWKRVKKERISFKSAFHFYAHQLQAMFKIMKPILTVMGSNLAEKG